MSTGILSLTVWVFDEPFFLAITVIYFIQHLLWYSLLTCQSHFTTQVLFSLVNFFGFAHSPILPPYILFLTYYCSFPLPQLLSHPVCREESFYCTVPITPVKREVEELDTIEEVRRVVRLDMHGLPCPSTRGYHFHVIVWSDEGISPRMHQIVAWIHKLQWIF